MYIRNQLSFWPDLSLVPCLSGTCRSPSHFSVHRWASESNCCARCVLRSFAGCSWPYACGWPELPSSLIVAMRPVFNKKPRHLEKTGKNGIIEWRMLVLGCVIARPGSLLPQGQFQTILCERLCNTCFLCLVRHNLEYKSIRIGKISGLLGFDRTSSVITHHLVSP